MKQLPSHSRGYLKPRPTPKVPEGLEELMEGLSREVLRHNPPDIYKFCTDHMKKLLDIRDAHLKPEKKQKTLEDKVKRVQNVMKLRSVEHIQINGKELKNQNVNVFITDSIKENSVLQSVEKETLHATVNNDDFNEAAKQIQDESTDTHNTDAVIHIPVIAGNLDDVVIKSQSTVGNLKNNTVTEDVKVNEAKVGSIEKVNEDIKKIEMKSIDSGSELRHDTKKQSIEEDVSDDNALTENKENGVHGINKDDKIAGDAVLIQRSFEDSKLLGVNNTSNVTEEVIITEHDDLEVKVSDKNNTIVNSTEAICEDLKESIKLLSNVNTTAVSEHFSNSETKEIKESVNANNFEVKVDQENNAKTVTLNRSISEDSEEVTKKTLSDVNISDITEQLPISENEEIKQCGRDNNLDVKTDDKVNAETIKPTVINSKDLKSITKQVSDINTPEQPTNVTKKIESTITDTKDNKEIVKVNDLVANKDKNNSSTVASTLIISNGLIEDVKPHLSVESATYDTEKVTANDLFKDTTQLVNNDNKVYENLNPKNMVDAVIKQENTHEVAEMVVTENKVFESNVGNEIKETDIKINQIDKTVEDLETEHKNENNQDIFDTVDVITNENDIALESKNLLLTNRSVPEETSSQDKMLNIFDNKNQVNSEEIKLKDIKENTHKSETNIEKDTALISAERKEIIEDTQKDESGSESPVCIADVIHAPDSAVQNFVQMNTKNSIENVKVCDEPQNVNILLETDKEKVEPKEIDNKDNKTENNIITDGKMSAKLIEENSSAPIGTVDSEGNNYTNKSTINITPDDVAIQTPTLLTVKSVESDNIVEHLSARTDLTTDKNSSTEDNTNDLSSESNADNGSLDTNVSKLQSPMDLETAAITIQKVFRTFMFRSRTSTLEDVPNYEGSIDIPYTAIDNVEDEIEIKENETEYALPPTTKERRAMGISRMDTVLQTVNEEKSLSLSTDDSSTLSSAATTIQAHVRGFLVRNRLTSNKTNSNSSLVNSDGQFATSTDVETENQKNKTVLNIHIVPEGGHYISRDESIGASIDLPFDVSPRTTNFHSLGSDISERRKQLKREDAIQSVSPPSNNSGKLSEDIESVKEFPVTVTELVNTSENQEDDGYSTNKELEFASHETSPTKSTTSDTVIEVSKIEDKIINDVADRRKRLAKMSSDEMDVVTPTSSTSPTKLMHSGEFHDVVLPTRVSRNGSSVVREFKSVLVYFLLWNK